MIAVRELTKLYGDFTAVRRSSFDVGAGRGPRARRPERRRQDDDASLPRRHHRAVERHRRHRRATTSRRDPIAAKRALAFIPDEPHLFDYLTVEEHLRFIARLYGVADVEARIAAAARRARARRQATRRFPASCRAACGRSSRSRAGCCTTRRCSFSTSRSPDSIRAACAGCAQTIAARAAHGSAVILSSHLLNLVEELCTKLLVLRRGEGVAYGTIDEIIAAHPDLAGRSLEDVFLALTARRRRRPR